MIELIFVPTIFSNQFPFSFLSASRHFFWLSKLDTWKRNKEIEAKLSGKANATFRLVCG